MICVVTLYNVLRHVIITLVLLIIICTWHYVTIKLLLNNYYINHNKITNLNKY